MYVTIITQSLMKCLWTYLTLQAFVSGLVSNVPVSHVWTVEGRQMCH